MNRFHCLRLQAPPRQRLLLWYETMSLNKSFSTSLFNFSKSFLLRVSARAFGFLLPRSRGSGCDGSSGHCVEFNYFPTAGFRKFHVKCDRNRREAVNKIKHFEIVGCQTAFNPFSWAFSMMIFPKTKGHLLPPALLGRLPEYGRDHPRYRWAFHWQPFTRIKRCGCCSDFGNPAHPSDIAGTTLNFPGCCGALSLVRFP